ncbi:serine/arginine repetitive matrix protein 3-like isoform X1 [Canis lupus familiaris]|uniref:serine/arginine repetitive matrix protein 3-like isoform X1 n=1 Tax=Canis lupus familiaris TaxID=9615 RepID=UPI000DC6C2C1|nr:serine/arginine repetitive matrix protein 3-like isoform X1 [Canis lupus familiaris]
MARRRAERGGGAGARGAAGAGGGCCSPARPLARPPLRASPSASPAPRTYELRAAGRAAPGAVRACRGDAGGDLGLAPALRSKERRGAASGLRALELRDAALGNPRGELPPSPRGRSAQPGAGLGWKVRGMGRGAPDPLTWITWCASAGLRRPPPPRPRLRPGLASFHLAVGAHTWQGTCLPVCHCALRNLLHSEVNCPEVLVKKLEEAGEWGETITTARQSLQQNQHHYY